MWLRIKTTLLCRLTFFIVLGVFIAGAIVTCSDEDSEPTDAPTSAPTATGADRTETVAGEQITLGDSEALVWAGAEPAVILVHGAIYDAASWTPQAEAMADAGMTVISVERAAVDAILLAAEHARSELGVDKIVLVGASAGAPPVLEAASQVDELAGVIILAGTGNAAELPRVPALFIAAEGDGGAADRMHKMADEAPGDGRVLIVEGDAHAQAIFVAPQGDDVLAEIIGWLDERR